MQTSLAATGVCGVAVPEMIKGSFFLNALTATTVVLESGTKAVFIVSSHVNATGVVTSGGESPPPQPACIADAAAIENIAASRRQAVVFAERLEIMDVSFVTAIEAIA